MLIDIVNTSLEKNVILMKYVNRKVAEGLENESLVDSNKKFDKRFLFLLEKYTNKLYGLPNLQLRLISSILYAEHPYYVGDYSEITFFHEDENQKKIIKVPKVSDFLGGGASTYWEQQVRQHGREIVNRSGYTYKFIFKIYHLI